MLRTVFIFHSRNICKKTNAERGWRNTLKMTPLELIKITRKARGHSIKMQNRLLLYWGALMLLVFAAILVILSFAGVFSHSEERVSEVLSLQQKNTYNDITDQFSRLTAKGISLSERTTDLFSEFLFNEPSSALNDSPEKLRVLELMLYDDLNTILFSSPCNGAFVVLDATTNTSAPNARNSRAGIFIRFANLGSNSAANQDVTLYRGIAEVARLNEIELHNRWKLEFDINNIPAHAKVTSFEGTRLADGCVWTKKMTLPETWEDVIFLLVPILSPDGNVAGVCGVELSELYFRLSHPAVQSEFGGLITFIGPIENGELMLPDGLIGNLGGTYIRDSESLIIKEGKYFNEYIGKDCVFLGIHQETDIRLTDGTKIYAVTLVSEDNYIREEAASRLVWITGTVILFVAMLFVSFVLAKKFVKPIAGSLNAIRDDNIGKAQNSGISEIDSLLSFMNKRNSGKDGNALPVDIEELFDEFEKRAETLTPTERSIIKYYAEGKEVNEIPELCFISINTVRKHNANIYKKLSVGSKEELMLYIELFRRCGRTDKLF